MTTETASRKDRCGLKRRIIFRRENISSYISRFVPLVDGGNGIPFDMADRTTMARSSEIQKRDAGASHSWRPIALISMVLARATSLLYVARSSLLRWIVKSETEPLCRMMRRIKKLAGLPRYKYKSEINVIKQRGEGIFAIRNINGLKELIKWLIMRTV